MTSDASRRPQPSKPSPRARSENALGRILLPLAWATSISRAIAGWRANLLLFVVTLVELVILLRTTATLATEDWIYVSQHLVVLAIALTRRPAVAQDQSWPTSLAVIVSYAYPYAQVMYLNSIDGDVAWPDGGIVLVVAAALLSLSALVSIGKLFGVRPALRGVATAGPYRLVRHPMYLAYFLADIGYLLEAWNIGVVLIAVAGWVSLLYRIHAEERMLSLDPQWAAYVGGTPYRLVPGLW